MVYVHVSLLHVERGHTIGTNVRNSEALFFFRHLRYFITRPTMVSLPFFSYYSFACISAQESHSLTLIIRENILNAIEQNCVRTVIVRLPRSWGPQDRCRCVYRVYASTHTYSLLAQVYARVAIYVTYPYKHYQRVHVRAIKSVVTHILQI